MRNCFLLSKRALRAFTLIELLVVIAIIAILVALLLPAVQQARESASRAACKNNFKQVALALHNYHDTHRVFPIGSMIANNASNGCTGFRPANNNSWFSWGTYLLPYVDQAARFQNIDYRMTNNPAWNPDNFTDNTLRGAIPVYLCPTNPQRDHIVNKNGTFSGNIPNGAGRTDIGGVADSTKWTCSDNLRPTPSGNGVLFNISNISFAKITDGASNTLLIGEITSDPNDSTNAKGHSYAFYDVFDTSGGINGSSTMPGGLDTFNWRPAGFSSYHTGGCHFALCDGSVRFFSENIHHGTLSALATRAGGEVTGEY